MMNTPRKLVHWALDVSMSEFGSPFSDASSQSMAPSSTLQYINSQLVAHGFTSSPGLSLEGVSNADCERVIKCLLSMLSQRIEDMSRTEELSTKLRTLSYDHERIISMHKTAMEGAANAEREMNVYKSRLTTLTRTLQSSEGAHKHTSAELQRARTSLQALRATHHSELKKKDTQIERMVDKWSKLSDAQLKLGTTAASGMTRCTNVVVVDGSDVVGKGQGFLETALEEAEKARIQLGEENLRLRRLVLNVVNEVQTVLHQAQCLISDRDGSSSGPEEELTPYTLATLFPISAPGLVSEKLTSVISSLRECLSTLSHRSPVTTAMPIKSPERSIPDGELEKLQGVIAALRLELEQTQQASATQAAQTQALFDKFTSEHLRLINTPDEVGDMSTDLMTSPAKDAERERLDQIKLELDQERNKFTEAAIRLGRERAGLEAERIKFLEEKRSWQVEMMLADLPATPPASISSPVRPSHAKSSNKSPRKSPIKALGGIPVGKLSTSRKTTRVSRPRRSSLSSPLKTKTVFEPAYETEVIPSLSISTIPIAATASILGASSLLPTTFTLPPPTPHSSLPSLSALPLAPSPQPTAASTSAPPVPLSTSVSPTDSAPSPDSNNKQPVTPPAFRRPFPIAKPLAQRMIHAYSPVKPSPLSRILMLANSPVSPESLGVLHEEPEGDDGGMFPALPPSPPPLPPLTTSDSNVIDGRDSPLREKKVEPNVVESLPPTVTAKGRVSHAHPEGKRFSAQEKGKANTNNTAVITVPRGAARTAAAASLNKENGNSAKAFSAPPASKPKIVGEGKLANTKSALQSKPGSGASQGLSVSRARLMAKIPIPPSGTGRGGPRRVPIDSAEAPPVGRGWRG